MSQPALFIFKLREVARQICWWLGRIGVALLVALLVPALRGATYDQEPMAGGVRARPQITAVIPHSTNVSVSWYGLQGSYTVEASPLGTNRFTPVASAVVSDFASTLNVPRTLTNAAQFRLVHANSYVGPGGCASCHPEEYDQWQTTQHSSAYSSIADLPDSVRTGCVVCHTIGQGQPTGFASITTTPYLANVGCENCHGPSGGHKYGDHSLVRPAVTPSANICGGCHTDAHHPTYDEWTRSGHATVTPDVAEGSGGILSTNAATGYTRQLNCGPCHSGATRLAMLSNYQDVQAGLRNPLRLPGAQDAATYAITCVVCHDPHLRPTNTVHQLRNPLFSTDFYTFFSGAPTNDPASTFLVQYNPGISLCGQCHNSRGATWQGTSRPPHHSPQYNLLIGAVQTNYLNGTNITWIATHGRNTNGCARCHVPFITPPGTVTDTNPVNSGHSFEAVLNSCVGAGCHSSTNSARTYLRGTQLDTTNRITEVVGLLNRWATNKAPALFTTNYPKYLANSWEFTTPGALASLTNSGPSTADQAKIPDRIKQARFNLYLVSHDGSLGVHNGQYSRFLLEVARTNVLYQLGLP